MTSTAPWAFPEGDEAVLWSGAPGRGRDRALLEASVLPVALWCVVLGVFVGLWDDTRSWFGLVAAVVVSAGVVQLYAPIVRRHARERHERYAVTDRRAVVLVRDRVAAAAPLGTPVVLRRGRRRERGTVLFLATAAADADPDVSLYDAELPRTWRAQVRGEPTLAAFRCVELDGLSVALQHAGFATSESREPGPAALLGALVGLGPTLRRTSTHGAAPAGAARPRSPLGWWRSRMRPHDVHLVSPLAPADALARLTASIPPPPSGLRSLTGTGASLVGNVRGWGVTFWTRSGRNAGWRFDGALYSGPGGDSSVLQGRLGPSPYGPIFLSCWLGVVGLVFLGGCIGTVVTLARGEAPPWPALLVPGAMLCGGVLVSELTFRTARSDWDRSARRLATTLSSTDGFVAGPMP